MCLFAAFHFYSEENVMIAIDYPDLKAHKTQHHVLLELINEKLLGFQKGEDNAKEIEEFLLHWFIHHAMEEDVKIGKFLSEEY